MLLFNLVMLSQIESQNLNDIENSNNNSDSDSSSSSSSESSADEDSGKLIVKKKNKKKTITLSNSNTQLTEIQSISNISVATLDNALMITRNEITSMVLKWLITVLKSSKNTVSNSLTKRVQYSFIGLYGETSSQPNQDFTQQSMPSSIHQIRMRANEIIIMRYKMNAMLLIVSYLIYIKSMVIFYSILFYSILFYSILFYSILFYSILFYSIQFYSIHFMYLAFLGLKENNIEMVVDSIIKYHIDCECKVCDPQSLLARLYTVSLETMKIFCAPGNHQLLENSPLPFTNVIPRLFNIP